MGIECKNLKMLNGKLLLDYNSKIIEFHEPRVI